MRSLSVLLILASFLSSAPAFAEDAAEAAIREAVQRYVAAYNAGDADGAAATYTPEGTNTYALGFTHTGRQEIAAGLRELLAGPMKGTTIAITTVRIRRLAPTIAVEEEAFAIEGLMSPAGQRLPTVKGLCLVVHQEHEQQWLAAAVQCMVPPPPPDAT